MLFVLLIGAALPLHAAEWVVDKVSQPARYTTDNETWTELKSGMSVPNASWIQTGERGRLVLRREAEMILFKPNTMASIVTRTTNGIRKTDVGQQFGGLLLDVETRKTKHTAVHTPYLAAVVKGTRFEVVVGEQTASLRVERGVVETTDLSAGSRVDVRAGQNVVVSSNSRGPLEVKGVGPKAKATKVKVAKPQIAPRGQDKQSAAGAGEAPREERTAKGKSKSAQGNAPKNNGVGTSRGKVKDKSGAESNGNSGSNGKDKANGKSKDKSGGKSNGNSSAKSSGNSGGTNNDTSSSKSDGKSSDKGNGKSGGKGKDNANGKSEDRSGGESKRRKSDDAPQISVR